MAKPRMSIDLYKYMCQKQCRKSCKKKVSITEDFMLELNHNLQVKVLEYGVTFSEAIEYAWRMETAEQGTVPDKTESIIV